MLALLTDLTLRDPALLLLALSVPVAAWTRRRRGEPTVTFAPSALIDAGVPLPRSWRTRLLGLPGLLHAVALLLVVVALARPVHRVRLPQHSEGIDILLCLDVSSSMAANDMDRERTRLDLAKVAAAQFITARTADRIGLVRFARYPDLLCPLTLDHGALQQVLAGVERVDQDSAEDMTGIGTAVARTAQVLRSSEAKSRIVVLLTDGEENVATADKPDEIGPARASLLAKELGVRVYTITAGIGKRSRSGEWLPLDTGQVRQLAEKTGGAWFEARDAGTLAQVYTTIDGLERVPFEEPRYELRERFLPFLLAALALLLCSQVLQATVFGVLP